MNECLFCRIVAGDVPAAKVYEDDIVLAFRDIAPMAKDHILIIPKEHVASSAKEIEDGQVLLAVFRAAAKIADELGLENGYRLVTNVGEDAGQTVLHLHFHMLAGEKLGPMA